MVCVKCNNCKASIPDEAAFCPNCGTPKGVQQPTHIYQPQQIIYKKSMSSGGSSPLESVFDMVFSKTAVIVVVMIGILLVWIGLVINIFSSYSNPAKLIASIGFAGIGTILIGGGVWNHRIDKFVRLAMVLIGVWAIVTTMSVLTPSFTSLFG